MMLPQDSLILAVTKLKTRRIRLAITIIVAGLLFVLLASVSFVMNGALSSVESFSEEGLGKRFILQLSSVGQDDYTLQSDPDVIAEAKVAFEALKKEKVAAAKKLGAFYDPASEQSPIYPDGPENTEGVDIFSAIGRSVVADRTAASTQEYYQTIKRAQDNYDVVGQYSSVTLGQAFGPPSETANAITTIKDGAEQSTDQSDGNPYAFRGIEGVKNGIVALSDDVLNAFALQDQSFAVEDGVVPIVAPFSAAQEILGLANLPPSASSDEELDRLRTVRENIAGETFQVCLRNQTSVDRQQLARQQISDAAVKNNKNYVKPDVMYKTVEASCQDVATTRDVRTAAQKKLEVAQEQFEQQFGKKPPSQRIVTFKVVGITSDPPSFESFQITDLLSSLLTSSVGSGWFIPLSSASALPEYATDFAKINNSISYEVTNYLELSSAAEARRFTDENTCTLGFGDISSNPFAECVAAGKPFFAMPFGSSSIALDGVRSGFSNIFSKAILVVALISALIMMGTVGKIISDSRRETAVFRAIGAKKLDIAQIYITYTVLISIIISLFALLAGWVIATIINNRYSGDFTVQSLVSFNASDLSKRFTLIGFDSGQIIFLVLVIVTGSVVASVIPLISNLRRNPIKDMRDER